MENILSLNVLLPLGAFAAWAVFLLALIVGLVQSRWLFCRAALVVAVLVSCGAMLYPPDKQLHLGLDLRGGTSLLYDVTVPEGQDRPRALKQTVEVLSRRVDPDGNRDISWRIDQAGRIEIQMPRPSAEVTERREAFEAVRQQIAATNVQRSEILFAVSRPPTEQPGERNKLVRGVAERKALLAAAAEAHDVLEQARARFQAAEREDRRAERALEVAAAERSFDQAVEAVLATNINLSRMQRIVEMSTKGKVETDDATGEKITLPSPREEALTRLKADNPRTDEIERLVEAYDAYQQVKGPLEDHEDLIRLLKGAGVLEFRITVTPDEAPRVDDLRERLAERGPRAGAGDEMTWLPIDDPRRFAETGAQRRELAENPVAYLAGRGLIGAEYGGDPYILLWNTTDKSMAKRPSQEGWGLRSVGPTVDQNYFPAVSFNLNPMGAKLMSEMTGPHVGRQMAIVLDGRVISAPQIQSKLAGQVMVSGGRGGFAQAEQEYLIRTLQAGSLDARLSEEPISITKIGSQYGEDNLQRGLTAARDALIVVALFMMVYFFFAGAVADAALIANIVIILGIMALRQAAFTLPGIAGVVLTIGMCVDANVLVFERLREELDRGQDMATAMRLGYSRALSAIIDGNITNLIVCVILYHTASAEVRGFAVTLGIGIAATLFTSLFMTRVIFDVWAWLFHIRRMRMLPMIVPPLNRLLNPNVRWVSARSVFFGISALAIAASLFLCFQRGEDMLDIEFRGGTQVTFDLADDPASGEPMTLELGTVRQRVTEVGDWFAEGFDPSTLDEQDLELYQHLVERVEERRDELTAEHLTKLETESAAELDAMPEAQRDQHLEPLRAEAARRAAEATDLVQMADATVIFAGERSEGFAGSSFRVATTVSDSRTVASVVKLLFTEKLDTTSSLAFRGEEITRAANAPNLVFPVTKTQLGQVINQPVPDQRDQDVSDYLGGVAIVLSDLDPSTTIDDIRQRIQDMRLQPDYEHIQYRDFKVVGLARDPDSRARYTSVAVVSRDPNIDYFDSPETWEAVADSEWSLVRDALQRDTSLASVSNFTPTVARTIQQQAIVALLLSFIAIIAYIWFRFGSFRFGLAATIALVHDVTIAMGFIAASTMIYEALGPDNFLLIEPYKINLALIAALLTIVGYSLNDTIVVFDRIRENRGKLAVATAGVINDSINQTISRTLLTSGTTLLAVIMLYVFGGEGVREFAFALVIGVGVGTYSSVAVAAPVLTLGYDVKRGQAPADKTAE